MAGQHRPSRQARGKARRRAKRTRTERGYFLQPDRLTVGNKSIGRGAYGTIYLGKAWFRGKKNNPVTVAVKVFNYAWTMSALKDMRA